MHTYAEPKQKDREAKPASSFSQHGERAASIHSAAAAGSPSPISQLQARLSDNPEATQLKRFQLMADRGPQSRGLAQLQTRMSRRGTGAMDAVRTPVASAHAAIQAKWIRRPGQLQPVWVRDDYVLRNGEVEVEGPREAPQYGLQSQPEFRERRRRMREAMRVPSPEIEQEKIGFPFKTFFDVPRNNQLDIDRFISELPLGLTKGGDLERLLRTQDLAHRGRVDETVPYNRAREALTSIQHAQNVGLDPRTLHQPSPQIDVEGRHRTTGERVQYDPLTSDQNPNPNAKSLGAWAEAYRKHTNESKGAGVTGVWDITSENAGVLGAHFRTLAEKSIPPGRHAIVDLQLDEEYALEDHYARIQLEHRKRRLKEAEERERERTRESKRRRKGTGDDRPTGREALPWGGPGPGAFNPYGWGQNHPLYIRPWRDDDAMA